MFARMPFFHVAGLVHGRHDKKVDVRVSFPVGDAPGVGVQNTVFKYLWIDLAIIPRGRAGGSVQPLRVVLIHGIFDHLKEVAMNSPCSPGAHAILSDEHIVSRQKRRGLGSEVGKDHPAELLHFIGGGAKTFSERAVGGLAGLFQDVSINVIEPTMVTTAQSAILDMAKLERGSPMRA